MQNIQGGDRMNELFPLSISNKLFYENYGEKEINGEFISIIKSKIDQGWSIKKNGIYFALFKNKTLPYQGWKIHISSTLENAEEILDIVSSILIKNEVAFKFLLDKDTLKMTSQKSYNRAIYGKFITIYPENTEQFKKLLALLYGELKDYDGPYILSDKRYQNCKVIYYRYGGFLPSYEYDTEGNFIYYIFDGHGRKVEDKRLPYFKLVEGISDIFPSNDVTESKLLEKYDVSEAIQFSNTGGVYLGKNKKDHKLVVIKEARPHTLLMGNGVDAIHVRKNEAKVMKIFEHTGYVPQIIDSFYDWEHFYIVVEYIQGQTLNEYVVINNPIPRIGSGVQIKQYLKKIVEIFIEISKFVVILHDHQYILGDFSLDNVMLTDDFQIKFIDLEGCIRENSGMEDRIRTNGFHEQMDSRNSYESDIYALGCLLFSCILKKTNMIHLNKDSVSIFLNMLCKDYSIPKEFKHLILAMTHSSYDIRPSIYEVHHKLKDLLIILEKKEIKRYKETYNTNIEVDTIQKKIKEGIEGVLASKHKTSLNIFPSTPFLNSKLNVSTGFAGIILGLNYLGLDILNDEFKELCLAISQNEPIGLYVGTAGILWTLIEVGEVDCAEILFEKHIEFFKVKNDYSIYSGLSGIGLVCLKFFYVTKKDKYLDIAVSIADTIMKWLKDDNLEYIGYKKGYSGISLFLLYVSLASGNRTYLFKGREKLLEEFSYQVKYDNFHHIDYPAHKESRIASPYFLEGTSGVLSVLLRYYKVTKEKYLFDKSVELANSLNGKYAFSPTLYKGIAGIGNILIDCYYILKNDKYKKMAFELAEGCLAHQIKYDKGILFPDLYISKLSTDFGYGTMGILMFLERLHRDNTFNFCFFLDNFI